MAEPETTFSTRPETAPETTAVGATPVRRRRSLPKKIALWFKGFFKLYRLSDQKAEDDSRYWDHKSKIVVLEQSINDINSSLYPHLSNMQNQINAVEERLKNIHDTFIRNRDELAARADDLGFRADGLAARADDLGFRADGLESRADGLEQRIDDVEPQFADRLLAFRKEQHDDNRGLIEQIAGLRREILFQQRRLTQLALPAPAAEQARTRARVADERLDSFHVAFEDVFGGAREDVKDRLVRYVDIVRDAGAGNLGKPVLDIGCGRGEWLELLKDKNIPAYGVDVNSVMVERTAALGLDARSADAIEHMRGLPDGAVSAVTAFHVVERLPFEVLIDFLDETVRVLAPGGVAIFETPNPETIRVGATTFYNDPTHRNPIPPQVLQFMAAQRGFQDVEILRLHGFADGLLTQPTADAQLLNRVIFGPKDYAVIGRRL